ncbi:hypothetical protein HWV07_09940 [Natronomonas salina]|uniref:DUF7529 family protein n=1 Tax=Natronomonas salina TaxID=1710540 RepID=UPI0015B6E1C6|nr:hypothetical protein [Natronomonas salina]QLD89331.1 hypothetical protein HWV07_09940 [Natronomonas salina]
MDSQGPPSDVADRWQELLVDADATAAEYREAGWEALVVRPGDVTPLDGDPFGLDVLAPAEEVETLEELVADVTFDTSHVLRAEEGGVRFCIVAVEAGEDEVAVVVPVFYDVDEAASLAERAREEGVTYTHVRPPSDDARVTFTHDDPSLFF